MKEKISLKTAAIILVLSFIITSCTKDKKDTPSPVPVTTTDSYTGIFTSSAHPTSGNATINSDKSQLRFSNFKTDSGPDLNIYLVSDLSDIKSDFIDVGDIKGINGNYTYDITNSIDFETYKYVVVWCVKYDVNFGYATLEK